MKFLHVISTMNPAYGGPIEGVRQIASENQRRGHQVEVVTLDSPGQAEADYPFPVHCLGPAYLRYGYCPGLLTWLDKHLAAFDAVIVNGIWQYTSLAARRACLKHRVPYYVFVHGMLDPWFRTEYPLKHLKKLMYWRFGEYRVLRDATAVLFTCKEEALLARQSFRSYQAREAVVGYGISPPPAIDRLNFEAFLLRCPSVRDRRFLLFLGRIHEKKGCDLLISAFSRIESIAPDLDLVFAGPDHDGLLSKLKIQCRSLGIEQRVHWPGMLKGEEKWGAINACEAFVLPSHQENFGIAVVEALALGKAVLISNRVNIWREIDDCGAGLIFKDSLEGTVSALELWLRMSTESRHSMESNALNCFNRHFSIAGASGAIVDLVEEDKKSKIAADRLCD